MAIVRNPGAVAAIAAQELVPAPRPPWKQFLFSARHRVGSIVNRVGLEHEDFTVLSDDCWGQALYDELGLPCLTPMIGAGMHPDCFLRFLGNVEGYLKSPLRFVSNTKHPSLRRLRTQRAVWPVGVIGDDVEIHFLHYRREDESRRMWESSCEKLNLNRLVVKFSTDKNGATQDHINRFAALPFERKLILSPREHPNIPCAVYTPNWVLNGAVMFRRSIKHFDCTHWLNTGEVLRNTPRVMINKLIYVRGV